MFLARQITAARAFLTGVATRQTATLRCRTLIAVTLLSAALVACQSAEGQYFYSVTPGVNSINLAANSGEVQSAVVAPGLKQECPAGRIFVSMDSMWPPQSGTVVGRDLNNPAAQTLATFVLDPNEPQDDYLTNDHDLITLANGDMLLIWGFHSDSPLNPKPAWFDVTTYTGAPFGPGVRRGTIVYRSQDCGKSFQYLSKIDPATLDDGRCAYPQFPHPGAPPPPPFLNGGTDGQLAKVIGGTVYLTMNCVGLMPDTTKTTFWLSNTPVSRTYILQSPDEGVHWNSLGFTSGVGWRADIEALANGDLAFSFGTSNFIGFAHKNGAGYNFSPTVLQPSVPWSWGNTNGPGFQGILTNNFAPTVLQRVSPGNLLVFAYAAMIKDSHNVVVDGYDVFFLNPATNQLSQGEPIFPSAHAAGNYTMHLVAIDPGGGGPVLLYWVDVNGIEKQATVMGRFVFANGTFSNDFPVATTIEGSPSVHVGGGVVTRPYSYQFGGAWYGDYHTAGGYAAASSGAIHTFHYYPMWVQSDGTVRYGHVSLTSNSHIKSVGNELKALSIQRPVWMAAPRPIPIEKVLTTVLPRGFSGDEDEPHAEPRPIKRASRP